MAARLVVFLVLSFLGLLSIQQHTDSAHAKLLQNRKSGEQSEVLVAAGKQKPSPSIKMAPRRRGSGGSSNTAPVSAGKQARAANFPQDVPGYQRTYPSK